jgi:phosphoglycolate phosphatase
MNEIYARHLTDLTSLLPGAAEAVRAVRGDGIGCAVVTNKPEAFSSTILAYFDLLADIETVIGGDSGYPKKPAPDMLLAACDRLGVRPGETVLVGDSGADLASARAAGIACILVRGGYCDQPVDELGADLVIADLNALPAVLRLTEEASP